MSEPKLKLTENAKSVIDSDIQILCALQNAKSAAALMLASDNYSMAKHGTPGVNPRFIFGQEFAALSKEAKSRGLIVEEAEEEP